VRKETTGAVDVVTYNNGRLNWHRELSCVTIVDQTTYKLRL